MVIAGSTVTPIFSLSMLIMSCNESTFTYPRRRRKEVEMEKHKQPSQDLLWEVSKPSTCFLHVSPAQGSRIYFLSETAAF